MTMTIELVFDLVAILALLVASAFFSSAETGLTAASDARMHTLARQGDRQAGAVEKLRREKDRLISSLLIGNNLVNVLATAIATAIATSVFQHGVVMATVVMTILLVLFAEVIPKTYAFRNADQFALSVARPVYGIVWLLRPVTFTMGAITRLIIKPRTRGKDDFEEELRGMIALHGHAASDSETREEVAMLTSVLDLDDVTVEEVMTHRGSVSMIDAAWGPRKILATVLASPYTRHPVYEDKPENITGVLHAKELLRAFGKSGGRSNGGKSVAEIAAKPYFIPETTPLFDQMQAFKSRREHFGIVVDEYGEFRGVITLEDILEEIVGEIDDEHDIEVSGIRSSKTDGSVVVDGDVTLRDLNRFKNWNLPDDDAATVAGLVLSEARVIPAEGQEFRFHGRHFRVLKRAGNKITRLRVWPEGVHIAAEDKRRRATAKKTKPKPKSKRLRKKAHAD